jgi:soluble lytic murein transglycosylase
MRSPGKKNNSNRKQKILITVILAAFCILAFYYSSRIDDRKYDTLIKKVAKKYNVDSRLIKAVIYQESKFDARVRGAAGEIGLMQIMPKGSVVDWARHYKVPTPREGLLFDPELNIEIGAWYLAKALRRWRNYKYGIELALSQYNAGGTRAEAWKPEKYDSPVIDRIKIKSTRAYVKSIMRKYKDYCKN